MSYSDEDMADVDQEAEGDKESSLLSVVPKRIRDLRACLFCGLVKMRAQFIDKGCDNCQPYLQMQGDPELVEQCTSSNFEGMAAVLRPSESWVARWQRLNEKWKPGCYAVAVHGRLTPDMISQLAELGIEYHPLDEGL